MTLGLSCYTVGRLWANTELEMALKISLHSWKVYFCSDKIKKKQQNSGKVSGRMERGPCPVASSVLEFCCSIGKLTGNKCYGRVKKVHQKQMLWESQKYIAMDQGWPKIPLTFSLKGKFIYY